MGGPGPTGRPYPTALECRAVGSIHVAGRKTCFVFGQSMASTASSDGGPQQLPAQLAEVLGTTIALLSVPALLAISAVGLLLLAWCIPCAVADE